MSANHYGGNGVESMMDVTASLLDLHPDQYAQQGGGILGFRLSMLEREVNCQQDLIQIPPLFLFLGRQRPRPV